MVTTVLTAALNTTGGTIVREADASWLEPIEGSLGAGEVSGLTSYEPLDEHATLVGGRWPVAGADRLEATLPEAAAKALGISVGDRLEIADSRDPEDTIGVAVVGLWRANEGDAFWSWLAERQADAEAGAQPLIVTFADVKAHAVSAVAMQWWTMPALNQLAIDDIELLRRDVAGIGSGLQQASPGGGLTVRTALPSIVVTAAQSLLVTRAGILALGAQFAVLAIYAVVLVSSILVERRRTESVLLRARGGSGWHLGVMALGEAVLLAVPVAAAAPWLAASIVRALAGITRSGDVELLDAAALGETPVVLAIASAAAGAIGLTIGSIVFNLRAERAHVAVGRAPSRTLGQRLGIDLALVGVAIIGFWQLRTYGAPLTRDARGALGIDPLLVLTPAIGLLAGAVLATRFLPRMAEVAERALVRLRTAVAPLAARHVARRPLRYTRSALLLMLAVALATFAALYNGTWTRSQADQATYRAAADARVILSRSPAIPSWGQGGLYRAIAEVDGAAPIFRDTVRVGRAVRDAEMVAVEPASLAAVLSEPDADLERVLQPLAAERPVTEAVPIEGSPSTMAVTIDADLRAFNPLDGTLGDALEGPGIGVALLLLDGDGRPQRIEAPEESAALLSGEGQRIEIPLSAAVEDTQLSLTPPLGLIGVEVLIDSDFFAGGSIDLVRVEASGDGGTWVDVALDPGAPAWHWERADFVGVQPYQPAETTPGRIALGTAESQATFSATTFRLWPMARLEEIPVVAGAAFLEQSGSQVGDRITGSGAVPGVSLRIVGSVDEFPTLDPAVPFVIADDPTVELSRFAANGQVSPVREWWLSVDSGAEASVLESVRTGPERAADVIGRMELTRELSNDPVALGVLGVLGLGSLAAMAFASIAFLAGATVSTTERVGEFAILRALGLSARQLAAWLAAESAFLLGFGLIAGTAAGILLGWLVLPFASFTQDGGAAVPSPVVVIPLTAFVPLYVLTVILFLASVAVVRRQLPAVRITDVLRGREEAG